MRQGHNNRRPRGRHHGGGNGNGGGNPNNHNNNHNNNPNRPRSAASLRNQTFDSNCIDVRVRGNAWQVHEKYQALARDAQSSGDRVAAENYLQHAEHYYRIIEAINEATAAEQSQRMAQQATYAQQPEVPTNYYGADGNLAQPPQGGQAGGQMGAAPMGAPHMGAPQGQAYTQPAGNPLNAPPVQGEAQVERPAPPQPFFAPEEMEEQGQMRSQQVAGRR